MCVCVCVCMRVCARTGENGGKVTSVVVDTETSANFNYFYTDEL